MLKFQKAILDAFNVINIYLVYGFQLIYIPKLIKLKHYKVNIEHHKMRDKISI